MDFSILLNLMSKGKDFNMARELQWDFDGDQNVRLNKKPLWLDLRSRIHCFYSIQLGGIFPPTHSIYTFLGLATVIPGDDQVSEA
jgi:hypothetical protein